MPLSNPIISRVAPVQVGGSPNAGLGFLASAFDHAHALVETAGPTNLNMGDILDNEAVRRMGAVLVGRQLAVVRLAVTQSTTSTAAVDVSSDLSFALKASTNNLIAFVVYYDTAAVTTGCRFALNYSGTLVPIGYALLGATSQTGMQCEHTTVIDTLLGQAGVGPGGTTRLALILAMIRTSTAGNLILRYASGVAASTVTVRSTSHGLHVQL